ncbi:MAG: hypothetical protein LLF83_07020 [Methanobacterium sp.]|nr:hypothetical protein [Methanobacterium sp.]
MVDVMEIKSVDLASYTLIGSSIRAIMAFIVAIIFLLVFEIVAILVPPVTAFRGFIIASGLALIIVYPIASFFINLSIRFYTAFVYNRLVSRISGIKLAMEGNELISIPVMSFSLILTCIYTIVAFILGLFLAAATAPFLTLATTIATNLSAATGIPFTSQMILALGTFKIIFLLILMPIMVFIFGFIFNALVAIFYNYIATKVSKIQLNFQEAGNNLKELINIPILPITLSVAVIAAVFGLLNGLMRLATLSAAGDIGAGVLALIMAIIGDFIVVFVLMAIGTFFYNFLAPKIGGVKLQLE